MTIGRRKVLAFGAVGGMMLGMLSLAGCGYPYDHSRYRFRMTVEVETPEGLKSGSSVYEVSANAVKGFVAEVGDTSSKVRGEAAAVDLPGNQTLFALLKTSAIREDMVGLSMTALDPAFRNDVVKSAARLQAMGGVSPVVAIGPTTFFDKQFGNMPMLVRFKDSANPATVELVDPANLVASFGQGYALKRITVQLTNDPVTIGIEKRLGWLGEYPEPSLNPTHSPTDFSIAATLHHGDFKQGSK